MSASYRRVNYDDDIKSPYKKQKNDKLRNLKGISSKDVNEDEYLEDEEKEK